MHFLTKYFGIFILYYFIILIWQFYKFRINRSIWISLFKSCNSFLIDSLKWNFSFHSNLFIHRRFSFLGNQRRSVHNINTSIITFLINLSILWYLGMKWMFFIIRYCVLRVLNSAVVSVVLKVVRLRVGSWSKSC